jgi:hypothetical protein
VPIIQECGSTVLDVFKLVKLARHLTKRLDNAGPALVLMLLFMQELAE